MAKFLDRVKETTTTTGTGNITLAGAATGYRAFSAVFAVGDINIPYCIADQSGTNWEVGYGTYVSANTLSRDTVNASSNAGALVSFTAGTKDVFLTITAEDIDNSTYGHQAAFNGGLALL